MSNATQNFTGCQPHIFPVFLPFFLSFIYFLGFLLNCISLWIFWFHIKKWNPTVVLQFNLAISDAIITPVVPFLISKTMTNRWGFGNFLCQFHGFLLSIHTYGSVYFLTLTSIHRYFTITYYGKKSLFISKLFITRLCLFVWTFLGIQGIPFFLALKSSEVHGVPQCMNIHQTDQKHSLLIVCWVTLFTGVLIPFSIMVTCYCLLTRYILKLNLMNPCSKAMVSKSVKMIASSLTILSCCYFPYHITRTVGVTIITVSPTSCLWLERTEKVYYIMWALSVTNCIMDPILYCFSSKKFKDLFMRWLWLRRLNKMQKREDGQELQAGTRSEDRQLDPRPTPSSTETGLRTWDGQN